MQGYVGLNPQQKLLPFLLMVGSSGSENVSMGFRLETIATALMKTKMMPSPPSTIGSKHAFHLSCELALTV